MPTLYPPLDDSSSWDENNTAPMKDGDDNVLSPELRRNFDTIKELVKQEEDAKKRKADAAEAPAPHEEIHAKKFQVAIETAVAVEDEISRLRNGIAELEALLAREEGEGYLQNPFPSLPPVVPDDWEQEDNRCDSTKGEGGMVHS
jgi:hypothetical protein